MDKAPGSPVAATRDGSTQRLPGSPFQQLRVESSFRPLAPVPTESFRRMPARQERFTRHRLAGFLGLHFLSFGAQIVAMGTFISTQDYWFFCFICGPFFFSGVFCARAAWDCDATAAGYRCLPLKKQPLALAALLAIPLGLLQGVIVILALEEYRARQQNQRNNGPDPDSTPSPTSPTPGGSQPVQSTLNKFHCKAVCGLFEGLISSCVLLYAFWSFGYPMDDPITAHKFTGERALFAVLGAISFVSSGLGLLELDFCTSKTIARRMRKSPRYEVMHLLFRFSEVASRVTLYVNFMVMCRKHSMWLWWTPFGLDILLTVGLINFYGGSEVTWLVRLLCSGPCAIANVFMFIDSPYKRRGAARLSRWLIIRNAIAVVLLPLAAWVIVPEFGEELKDNWSLHPSMICLSIASVPLYWVLLWWINSKSIHKNNISDIYTACETGNVALVRSSMRELTHSAAVGLNINCFDIDGTTPLMLAAFNGHCRVITLLLDYGARVDVRIFGDNRPLRNLFYLSVRRRWTAMHIAAHRNHLDCVQVLLEAADSQGAGEGTIGGLADFQDEKLDTPLHVAAWAGHAETAGLLASRRPTWVDERNQYGLRPVDLARQEEVKRQIEGLEPLSQSDSLGPRPMGSPLLMRREALPGSGGSGVRQAEAAWPSVQLNIAKSSKDGQLMAPGLCSYIASSCGGALGRVFLQDAPPRNEGNRSALSVLSELDEHGLSIVSAGLYRPDSELPLPTITAAVGSQGTGAASAGGAAPQQHAQPLSPLNAMEDLEPIDHAGTPVRWWLAMVQSQRLSTGGATNGKSLMRVPEESVLGEGSYGLVWRAKDRGTKTWYAVKNIKTARRGAPSVAMRECEVADHIRLKPHPCLVYLYHVHNFTDSGLYVLVMEFCPGGDVLGSIRTAKQDAQRQHRAYLAPQLVHRWIGQVFLGLEHMHRRMETLLRDLKPENVVLTKDGRAKLTDFGFGRFGVESTGRWSFGIPTGSPGYVAPEVLRKEEYDERADLYSLGVLVWVMLTGGLKTSSDPLPPLGKMRHQTDFEAHFADCQRLKQCVEDPERHHAQRLREDARDFVLKLTQRRPADRMRHKQIREHRMLESLRMPPYEAAPTTVDAWCFANTAQKDPGGPWVIDNVAVAPVGATPPAPAA